MEPGISHPSLNMLSKVGGEARVTSDPLEVVAAEKIVLPGVGAFDAGMRGLEASGLAPVIRGAAREGKPILGICLGAQLLGRRSAEGVLDGLGLVAMDVVRFQESADLRVPNMGWRGVTPRKPHRLIDSLPAGARFYFAHSYHMVPDDAADVLLTSWHGQEFVAAVACGSIVGVQFHPEKSHKFGMRLLKSFTESGI